MRTKLLIYALWVFIFMFTSCASTPPVKEVKGYTPTIGEKATRTAISMIGRPYKYRGQSPTGFDCSGLVRYSYRSAGLDVPHGSKNLLAATQPVSSWRMQKGDVLFFDEKRGKYTHVGIYIGDDTFVHAPSSGKKVRKNSLNEPYWKKNFLEARRFPQ